MYFLGSFWVTLMWTLFVNPRLDRQVEEDGNRGCFWLHIRTTSNYSKLTHDGSQVVLENLADNHSRQCVLILYMDQTGPDAANGESLWIFVYPRWARHDCPVGMTRGCAAYHGTVWHVRRKISEWLQPHYGAELYSEGNDVLLVVPIGDVQSLTEWYAEASLSVPWDENHDTHRMMRNLWKSG